MRETQGNLANRFAYLDERLAAPFLIGERFTIADAYLFTVVNWTNFHGIDLSPYPNLQVPGTRRRPPGRAAGAAGRRPAEEGGVSSGLSLLRQ